MSFLRSLFARRRPIRHFALLDAEGNCRALRQSQTAPDGRAWVEVAESRLNWLDAPLPAAARVIATSTNTAAAPALTA